MKISARSAMRSRTMGLDQFVVAGLSFLVAVGPDCSLVVAPRRHV